ncbi:MAG: hypothetical protein WDO74_23695 [Pseudomonadota bacterium]
MAGLIVTYRSKGDHSSLILPHAAGTSLWERWFRFVPGPLFCVVVGGVGVVMPGAAIPSIDYWWFAC